MTLPPPVPASALRRLRRSYALLMSLLGIPVLAVIVYVLVLQFQLVWVGTQRQMAMSADRRVTRLDGVLGPLRHDLLRLRSVAGEPALARDAEVDRRSLMALGGDDYTLDALPPLLSELAPQLLLHGKRWQARELRETAVSRAALFGEQARLLMSRGSAFKRAYYADAQGGELWLYPWVRSDDLLRELGVASIADVIRLLAERTPAAGSEPVIEGQVRWRVGPGEGPTRIITLSVDVPADLERRAVAAELPAQALAAAQIEAGIGRFWVVDGQGQVLVDHVARDHPASALMDGAPPAFEPEQVEQARTAPLALHFGPALLAARSLAVAPWTALYLGDSAHVRRLVLRDMGPYITGGGGLLLLFLAVAALLWRRFGQPSLRLVDYLHRQVIDAAATEPRVPRAWVPWLHLVRDTFVAAREAAAREQKTEALKSSIVDHALAAVVATDAQGRIVEFNPAAERMFSRTREEALGREARGMIIPERLRSDHELGWIGGGTGEGALPLGQRIEATALRADGSEFPVEMVLWRATVGPDTFYTASMFDLTERRRAAEEIERQRDALRQSEKLTAMGSLLAGVAHELNNPLAIVMGRAGLLEAKAHGTPLADDALRIREAAERCGRIVRTFLSMARNKPPQRSDVKLNDLVRAAADLLQYGFRSHGIRLQLRLADSLPAVRADADQIGQVVLNLLVNVQQALAGHEGVRDVRVETGVEAVRPTRPPRVWLRVADSGPGVPAPMRERIFEPFFTTKPEGIGTGLGLAVSRSIVREHGGDLMLEVPGAAPGASFRISLPISGEPELGHAAQDEAMLDAEPPSARVLVVDDEPELVDMMREMLESDGYEVACAESGAIALEMLEMARFDAIVSDLRMPDMDGASLWREIERRQPALARRTVFVTGDTLSPGASAFLRDTGCACLEKPFAPSELLTRVADCLNATAE
jgi:two-component system NtrC family sensor kinase